MIDPRRRTGGSALTDLQATGSAFRTIAQNLGMANPPKSASELLTYLQQFLSAPQLELVRYMFLTPQQFQTEDNVFGPGLPAGVPGVTADIPVAADRAAAMGSTEQPATQGPAPQAANPQPAAQAASQEPTGRVEPVVEKPAQPAQPEVTKVAQPRADVDPDGRIRMFMKDGSQTFWDPKNQSITPTAERVAPGQKVRYTIKHPDGKTQNIY